MRKILLTAVLASGAALALFVAACKAPDGAGTARDSANTAATPAAPGQTPRVQPPADVVRRVTPNELKGMMDRGEAVAVDVRAPNEYGTGHIKGSLLIPRGELPTRVSELPKDKLIVFYCA
jgi:3-mercaptopyruvate sulfurtransferase SseA